MEKKVIDVSYHQGIINWTKVGENVDGAIIRCGYGSDIKSQDDPQFKANVEGCIVNGIPFGIYLYSYAKTIEAAKDEAAHVLRLAGPYKGKLSYPVYLDLEEPGTESGAVERAVVFGGIVEEAGYFCGIYADQRWWQMYLKSSLDRFTKWVARHSDKKPEGISGTYDMWQYSSEGNVAGISGDVDMNICYRDFPIVKEQGPTAASKLTVDGLWGPATTKRLQEIFGTPQDGVVSSQPAGEQSRNPGLANMKGWDWKEQPAGISALIRAIQKKVGTTQDSWIGKKTITAMQQWLGTVQDGVISNPSVMVKALQNWCNAQR